MTTKSEVAAHLRSMADELEAGRLPAVLAWAITPEGSVTSCNSISNGVPSVDRLVGNMFIDMQRIAGLAQRFDQKAPTHMHTQSSGKPS